MIQLRQLVSLRNHPGLYRVSHIVDDMAICLQSHTGDFNPVNEGVDILCVKVKISEVTIITKDLLNHIARYIS